MSRILIAGCGEIGSRLGLRLAADGHEVWGLRRSEGALPEPIHALRGDLARRDTFPPLPADLHAVVYTATADSYDDDAYQSAYVHGPRNLMRSLAMHGQSLERFIFVSSTSVYGQSDGEWVDEDSPTHPRRFSGRRVLDGERVVLESSTSALAVRFGGIYGPGRNRLLERVRDGMPCQARPPVYTNRIHRDDCVAVLRHLLSLDRPERIYLAVDCEPAAQCEVMDWLASRLGVPAPPRIEPVQAPGAVPGNNKRCRNARLLASGYRFLYPDFRAGYATILAEGPTCE